MDAIKAERLLQSRKVLKKIKALSEPLNGEALEEANRLNGTTCFKCGSTQNWHIIKRINSIGREMYRVVCASCGKEQGRDIKKNLVPESVINGIPARISEQKTGACARCGNVGYVEEHHWAPHKYFDDSEKWPTSLLCRTCHERWHQVMTGDLVKKFA